MSLPAPTAAPQGPPVDRRTTIRMLQRFAADEASASDLLAMRAAVRTWLADPDLDLDGAFGLRPGRGERSVRSVMDQLRRDEHLRLAGHIVAGVPIASLPPRERWSRVQLLSGAIAVFNARRWPAWKDLEAVPPGSTWLDHELFAAARAVGKRLPQDCGELLAIVVD